MRSFSPLRPSLRPEGIGGGLPHQSVVAGQLNAMRMVQKETAAQMTTVLFHLSGIDRHTAETAENTRYLKAIHDRLMRQSASDPLRAQGRA